MNCKFDGCPTAEMQQALQHKALVQNISRNRADLTPWHTTCSLLSDERAVARYRYVYVAVALACLHYCTCYVPRYRVHVPTT